MPIFIVFRLTRPGIETESTVSVADALFTRPLIGLLKLGFKFALVHFVLEVAMARRLQRDLLDFKSSWHLPSAY